MLIPTARAGKLFGGDGGLTLTLYPAFPEDFTTETPLFARIDGLDVPLWCERFERRGVTGAVVRFADLDTERRASELLGKELFIDQTEEADDDEFYMEDLIGFRALGIEIGADAAADEVGETFRPVPPQPAPVSDTQAGAGQGDLTGKPAAASCGPFGAETAGTPKSSPRHTAASESVPSGTPCGKKTAGTADEPGRHDTPDKTAEEAAALSGTATGRTAASGRPTADTDGAVPSPAEGDGPASAIPGAVLKRFTGEITDYYDSETNPLLEIRTDDGTEVLVPAAEEFIGQIDFEGRRIEFILPEGLLDLNRK